MKRLVTLVVAVSLVACGIFIHRPSNPFVVTVYAQTLPVTKTAAWDPNPVSDGVLNYTLSLDGTVVANPTGTTQPVTFTTAGSHTLSLTATNMWGTSTPTTLTVNVVIPVKPVNLRLQ